MDIHHLETDYLVVGCGAAGMAFADSLVASSPLADVVMVDRRPAPGGHWNDAYPFVRLHQPAAYYGVNSLPLGQDTIDRDGLNQGLYEQASAPQICAHFGHAMQHLLASGRVRYFPMCEYSGDHRFASRISGTVYEVAVHKALVDATYLEPAIPAHTRPPFEVADDARCVPVHQLPEFADHAQRIVVIGGGKTAIDACQWLIGLGLSPEAICWIKPREAWLLNRVYYQCGELVANVVEGLALQMEAAAQARSLDDLFARLEASNQLLRCDRDVAPTMFKAPTVTEAELAELRQIGTVVRGRVLRIERHRIVLREGEVPTTPDHLHVHCAAAGLNPAPAIPIFAPNRITPQPIRIGLTPFNAALVGFVEASGRDLDEKNRLCPPNRFPDSPRDWLRGTIATLNADRGWSREPDIAAWLDQARLNPTRGLRRRQDPHTQAMTQRFAASVRPGLTRLAELLATSATR
jgi:hypothetical protein